MIRIGLLAVLCFAGGMSAAVAATYPVMGKWAYDRGVEPEEACRKGPTMEFRGERRFDTGGGVPDYRNRTISPIDRTSYRIVDQFFNGQTRGNVIYTLRMVDDDHVELYLSPSGKTIKLLRCR
jgi:hypothetical protein